MGKIPKPEHQKSRGKCIFCKEWGVSKEHVFPDWLQQLLPKGPNDTHQHGTVIWALDTNGIPIRVPTIRRRQGQASSKKVRTVCENCNNGWLSALEERTKPLLRRMVCGKPHRLNDLDQRMLATWVAKTAMVAEGVQAGVTAIPQTHRDLLKSSLAPPVGWTVWISGYHGTKWITAMHRHGVILGEAPIDPAAGVTQDTQQTTISIGWFLCVAVSTIADYSLGIRPGLESGLRQIWPIQNSIVRWPPGFFYIDAGADWVADTLPLSLGLPGTWTPPT